MHGNSTNNIHEFWRDAATDLIKDGRKATAPDAVLQGLIEQAIINQIPTGSSLLDIGCGDGSSTRLFAEGCAKVVGVDFVSEFVNLAKQSNVAHNVLYEQGNVLDLSGIKDAHGAFDVVTTIRCLINLNSWDLQCTGLAQIAALVRPGGLYLASEGWSDGIAGLNHRRSSCGLAPIPVVHHNLFMDRAQFREEAEQFFDVVAYISFGLYLYLSRVVQPLAVFPEPPSYGHPINIAAMTLQNCTGDAQQFVDTDYAGLFILKKKAA